MKTLKITEDTHRTLIWIKGSEAIDHKLSLKTFDEVIEFLYYCYIETDSATRKRIAEDFKNDKQR